MHVHKYRKKPVVIEAVQYRGGDPSDIVAWISAGGGHAEVFTNTIRIRTLEGSMCADPSDWIIRGVKGEFYPIKPDIFAETYERVDEGRESVVDEQLGRDMSDIIGAVAAIPDEQLDPASSDNVKVEGADYVSGAYDDVSGEAD